MRTLTFAALISSALSVAVAGDGQLRSTKIIYHGWDLIDATPSVVLANAEKFKKVGIDGVTLRLSASLPDGRKFSFDSLMNDPVWNAAAFTDQLPVLRKIAERRHLRESLLCAWLAPKKRLDWRDDAAWNAFATSMGVLSAIAREAGLKGILIDEEDYPKTKQYGLMPDDPSYDVAAKLARKRGREVFSKVFAAYPNITLLAFRLLAREAIYSRSSDPLGLAASKRDLWPWFVNGMVEVMPMTVTLIEGNEHAYKYDAGACDFFRSACEQHSSAINLIMPENRFKYRGVLRAGFGLYLDSYICSEKSEYYKGSMCGSRLRHFAENLGQAAEAADGYVWIYGERKAIIPWNETSVNAQFAPNGTWRGVPTWNDALPGFNDELLLAKDVRAYIGSAVSRMKEAGTLTNLATATARPWPIWHDGQSEDSSFGSDGDSVFIKGPARGCHHVHIDGVKPGERYAVLVKCRGQQAVATVFWKKDDVWRWELPGFPLTFVDGKECRDGGAVATVPQGVNRLVINLGASVWPGETVVFDQVEVYRIEI